MSQENVDALRNAYEAFSRGDWDAALQMGPPDFEFKTAENKPIAGTYPGREEVRRLFEELWAAFAEVRVQPERFIDLEIGSWRSCSCVSG